MVKVTNSDCGNSIWEWVPRGEDAAVGIILNLRYRSPLISPFSGLPGLELGLQLLRISHKAAQIQYRERRNASSS